MGRSWIQNLMTVFAQMVIGLTLTLVFESVTIGLIVAAIVSEVFNAYFYDKVGVNQNGLISRPPGMWLLRCAELVYSRQKFDKVLQPTILDMQDEYFISLAANRVWKARIVRLRGTWSFIAAVGMDIPLSAIGLIRKIWTAAH
jgi:hypothetical protein